LEEERNACKSMCQTCPYMQQNPYIMQRGYMNPSMMYQQKMQQSMGYPGRDYDEDETGINEEDALVIAHGGGGGHFGHGGGHYGHGGGYYGHGHYGHGGYGHYGHYSPSYFGGYYGGSPSYFYPYPYPYPILY
jgi:hypothetical protein